MPDPVNTRLADGSPVIIGPVGPQDAGDLLAGFERLSRQSRLFRFLHMVERLRPAEVRIFTTPDQVTHVGIGGRVVEKGIAQPGGIAHLFRGQSVDLRAEMAVTVVDAYQGRGFGSLLLGRLLLAAARLGIRRLDAVVHPCNRGMAHILRQLRARERRDGATLFFDLAVHRDPARYPDTRTGDAIRAAYALVPRSDAA